MTTECLKTVISEINKLKQNRCIVAIDGRCAAGKSTLAQQLKEYFQCSVIHMDDFFLQPHQRTKERLEEPGGNIDYERFLQEVIHPLQNNLDFSYRVFDCKQLDFKEKINVHQTDVIIIEGSYSCHPNFKDIYDLKLFLDVDKDKQLLRIERRNGSAQLNMFIARWIPMEEKYFETFDIKDNCDIVFKS